MSKKKLLVWYFKLASDDKGTARKRLQLLEEMGFEPTLVNIAKQYNHISGPAAHFKGFDAFVILGASELFFDGGKSETHPMRVRAHDISDAVTSHINYILEKDFPTFAFCFGHQLIANILGSKIGRCAKSTKTGTYRLTLTAKGEKENILAGVPKHFSVQYAHKDVVEKMPKGAALLASSSKCRCAMFRYGKNVYTSQFHPELSAQLMREVLREVKHKYADPKKKVRVYDAPHGSHIFVNFGHKVLDN